MPSVKTPLFSDQFPTTSWTIVIQTSEENSAKAAEALESLCQQYREPLIKFAQATGLSLHDAEDLVQEFLMKIVRTRLFSKVEEGKGRLRSYLLKSIRNFLKDDWRKKSALKRKGDVPVAPLELARELPSEGSEEKEFDRAWARSVMDQALEKLKEPYLAKNRGDLFDYLFDAVHETNITPGRTAEICRTYNIRPNTLSKNKSRFLSSLGNEIRNVIAHTVTDFEQVEEEIAYFRKLWGSGSRNTSE